MAVSGQPIVILLADDDEDDRLMTRQALERSRLANELRTVADGEELLDFLYRRGKHVGAPRPGIILLDLNMPRMDGREALQAIKSDPTLSSIPGIVMTTSSAEEDVLRSYGLGANSFVTKPVGFEALVKVMGELGRYWFQVVELPL